MLSVSAFKMPNLSALQKNLIKATVPFLRHYSALFHLSWQRNIYPGLQGALQEGITWKKKKKREKEKERNVLLSWKASASFWHFIGINSRAIEAQRHAVSWTAGEGILLGGLGNTVPLPLLSWPEPCLQHLCYTASVPMLTHWGLQLQFTLLEIML